MAVVHLTYDDGPGEETAELLDVLRDAGARATFFVIAAAAAARPAVLERMVRDGHTVALHCFTHVRHTESSEAAVRADTRRGLAVLAGMGIHPGLWRTPWGAIAPFTGAIAASHRLRLINWTHDTHDWRGDDADAMFATALPALRDGAIVLAHDGLGPGALRPDARETVSFTRRVVEHATRRRLALAAIG